MSAGMPQLCRRDHLAGNDQLWSRAVPHAHEMVLTFPAKVGVSTGPRRQATTASTTSQDAICARRAAHRDRPEARNLVVAGRWCRGAVAHAIPTAWTPSRPTRAGAHRPAHGVHSMAPEQRGCS